ncbi:uncharacterized protein [Nicotiana sylvestris]|uniref:uncharacterized protein n=1 Tax=Nicotiana sylvestris TaxID=4096 RepID=UPI00388CAA2E
MFHNQATATDPPITNQMQIDTTGTHPQIKSFLQTLTSNSNLPTYISNTQSVNNIVDLTYETSNENDSDDFIPLTAEDKAHLYTPWQNSIIVKVFGRTVGHHLLKAKLMNSWQPTEEIHLIDLGCNFFLIKFRYEENMYKALHEGPWFILNHFLSVRRWEPKLIASGAQLTYAVLWVRLPELPTEFYDFQILQKVGNKIGKLLKVDTCTTSITRGRTWEKLKDIDITRISDVVAPPEVQTQGPVDVEPSDSQTPVTPQVPVVSPSTSH